MGVSVFQACIDFYTVVNGVLNIAPEIYEKLFEKLFHVRVFIPRYKLENGIIRSGIPFTESQNF